MNIRRGVPDIESHRIDESRDFYAGFLGFHVGMDMGWVIMFVSTSNPTAQDLMCLGQIFGGSLGRLADGFHQRVRPSRPAARRARPPQACARPRAADRCHGTDADSGERSNMQSLRGRDRGGDSGHQAGKANADGREGRLVVAGNCQVDAGSGAPRREVDDHETCR